jgi:hypothetical protein
VPRWDGEMKALIDELGRRMAEVERALSARWRTPESSIGHQSLLAHYHLEQQVNDLWETRRLIPSSIAFPLEERGPTWRYRLCISSECRPPAE